MHGKTAGTKVPKEGSHSKSTYVVVKETELQVRPVFISSKEMHLHFKVHIF